MHVQKHDISINAKNFPAINIYTIMLSLLAIKVTFSASSN